MWKSPRIIKYLLATPTAIVDTTQGKVREQYIKMLYQKFSKPLLRHLTVEHDKKHKGELH